MTHEGFALAGKLPVIVYGGDGENASLTVDSIGFGGDFAVGFRSEHGIFA